ncbi:hypothetical protein BGX26_001889 [Mortierella sp. AD094]|nr:hypothetical protein BGX26_001889 [Mortierella sp. AD094]
MDISGLLMTIATTPAIIEDAEDEEYRLLDSIIDEFQMKDYSDAPNAPKRVGDTNTIRFTDNEVAESDRAEVDDEEEEDGK